MCFGPKPLRLPVQTDEGIQLFDKITIFYFRNVSQSKTSTVKHVILAEIKKVLRLFPGQSTVQFWLKGP